MGNYRFHHHPQYERLAAHANTMQSDDYHLRELVRSNNRLEDFSVTGGGIFFDFSRQRVVTDTMAMLFELAEKADVRVRFSDMIRGKKVNSTENRAALHTATRDFSDSPVLLDGQDIKPELKAVRRKIEAFSQRVHGGEITGSTGKAFRHVVVVGIGGSYLGTEFVAKALTVYADRQITLDFLANVDIHNFGAIWMRRAPEQTLWIIISKSYTTVETMANEALIRRHLDDAKLDPSKHIVTVTSKGSPGDQGEAQNLASFYMFDFIGGRYSVTSAVGGVPLSLYFGYDRFERFLKGAQEMDIHAVNAPPEKNLPLIAALITIWNTSFLQYPNSAIIPYASPLCRLTPHVQQLNMESNGKSVDTQGRFLPDSAGTVVFGEPGTNAQHSFFQLAHQGKAFPIDFIGVLHPQYRIDEGRFRGVEHQQELWANMLAQATALANGRKSEDPARFFSGNRPSSTIVLENLEPENVGRLLAFYEAKTIFEAFIWGINPFDQFGVELGKVTAGTLRSEIAARNEDPNHDFADIDPINRAYLQMMFDGRIPR